MAAALGDGAICSCDGLRLRNGARVAIGQLRTVVGAEFIGTFILIFVGTATAIVNQKTQGSQTLIGCADSTGLAVTIVILSTSHIFGAHLNLAV